MTFVLALDPGYGNTKVCNEGRAAMIQSAVSRPRDVGLAAVGLRTASQAREVTFDRYRFAVGPGAWNWGNPLGSLDYAALASPERRAMFYAALADLLPAGAHSIDVLVVGLPVPLLQDQVQAESVFASLKSYKLKHVFRIDQGQPEYEIDINRLKVLAQPVGAYADWLLDNESVRPRKGGKQAEVAVLDLGMNTLDLYVIQGGKVSPRFVGGGKVGVRRLLELLNGDGKDIEELDAALRTNRLRPSQADLESWLGEVLGTIERTWPSLKRFSAVIPAGGGALVLGDLLRVALVTRGAAVYWPEDPIAANVRGLWKWGAYERNKGKR